VPTQENKNEFSTYVLFNSIQFREDKYNLQTQYIVGGTKKLNGVWGTGVGLFFKGRFPHPLPLFKLLYETLAI